MLRFLDPRSDFRVLQHHFDTMLGPPKNEKSLKIKFCLKNVSYWLLSTKIGGVNSIHFFDLTLSFWCRAKKCFRSLFFIWLNSAISQNVKHIFEKKNSMWYFRQILTYCQWKTLKIAILKNLIFSTSRLTVRWCGSNHSCSAVLTHKLGDHLWPKLPDANF